MKALNIEQTNNMEILFPIVNEISVISELKILLADYIKKKSISLNAFCIKNDLSTSTVHHLLSGRTKKSVSPEIARKIVFGMNKGEPISSILLNTKGNLGEFLRERYSSLLNVSTTSLEANSSHLNNKNARLIMMLAHQKGGTTREDIILTLGQAALLALNSLLKKNTLIENKDKSITGLSENIYLDIKTTKSLIQEVTNFSTDSQNPDAKIKIVWGKISKTKLKKRNALATQFAQNMQELYEEEDEDGEFSFITMTADTLIPNKQLN